MTVSTVLLWHQILAKLTIINSYIVVFLEQSILKNNNKTFYYEITSDISKNVTQLL